LRLSLPAELHVDFWLAVVATTQEVRGFLAPRSLATQCQASLQNSIPHLQWDVVNVKILLPDITGCHPLKGRKRGGQRAVRTASLACLAAALLLAVVVARRRGS
jgi:hypothetical protein